MNTTYTYMAQIHTFSQKVVSCGYANNRFSCGREETIFSFRCAGVGNKQLEIRIRNFVWVDHLHLSEACFVS